MKYKPISPNNAPLYIRGNIQHREGGEGGGGSIITNSGSSPCGSAAVCRVRAYGLGSMLKRAGI